MKNLGKLIPNIFKKLVIIQCSDQSDDESCKKAKDEVQSALGIWYHVCMLQYDDEEFKILFKTILN